MHYFCADMHIGDKSILQQRPQFVTLGYHDEFMWNLLADVKANDEVTFVGDCFVGAECPDILRKFSFKKRLVVGNHDFERKLHYRDFDGILDHIEGSWRWPRHPFLVSHFPVHEMALRQRLNIHGHLHEKIIPDTRYINVSMEAAGYRLVSHEEIIDGSYRTFRT